MDFCNWYAVNEKHYQNGLSQVNCMDISTENLVKMDNKRNNLIQHTLIGDHVSKDGIKAIREIDTNEAYNILWKSLQFLKGLSELQKIYKKLRSEPDLDKKVDFLKTRDKLMKEKPLKVMGLKVSYSDTSLSISEENELPPFRKALLTDTLPTELKTKKRRIKKRAKIKKKEIPEPTEPQIEEEPRDLEAHVVKPGRTTSNKKDYEKAKKKKMAELKKLFPDPPKVIKKVPKKEEEEPVLEEMYSVVEEQQSPIEEALGEEEEPVIEEVKKVVKPPKPKKRIIKKIKKKEPPKEEPKPLFKLRKPQPGDKRRVSASDAVKAAPKGRGKRRWTFDAALNYRPSKIDLSPLNIKLPEPPPPPIKLRKPQPGDKRRVSDSDTKKKESRRQQRKRRWSYSYGAGSGMGQIKLDRSPLKIKLKEPEPKPKEPENTGPQIGKVRGFDPKKDAERKLKSVGKLKLPEAFARLK